MKIDKRDPRHWLLLVQQAVFTAIAILVHWLAGYAQQPRVVLYGHQLSGNLKALYDTWADGQHSFECLFLSLDPQYSDRVEAEGIKVLRCARLRDMLTLARSRVVITDHGLHMMTPMVWLTRLKFIDVWHGIPYKGFVPGHFRVHHHYDEAWVASPLHKQLYTERYGFREERVIPIGYARVDQLFGAETTHQRSQVRELMEDGTKLVLYAPTWQQDDSGRALFPFGESQVNFISQLSEVCARHGAKLGIRSHLNASIDHESPENVIYLPMKDFPDSEDVLLGADVLICDWSSIAFDYLALRRPAIFLDVKPPFKFGLSLGGEFRYGEVVTDMAELLSTLSVVLEDIETFMHHRRDKYDDVIKQVYAENVDAKVATRQLARLERLLA